LVCNVRSHLEKIGNRNKENISIPLTSSPNDLKERWLATQISTNPSSDDKSIVEASREAILFSLLSLIDHQKIDNNEFKLTTKGQSLSELETSINKLFNLGNIERLFTKRFIKTIRGSSYEVDLRLHESISLINNVLNTLLKSITRHVFNYCFSRVKLRTYCGKSFKLMIVDGLNLALNCNYESLLQDGQLITICSRLPRPPVVTSILSELDKLLLAKSQLKYVNEKGLLDQVNLLESTGDLRPNMNNHTGCTGLRIFPSLSYFKLYYLEGTLAANSVYLTKDVEDRLAFVGLEKPSNVPLGEEYAKSRIALGHELQAASEFRLHLLSVSSERFKDRAVARQLVDLQSVWKRKVMKVIHEKLKHAAKVQNQILLANKRIENALQSRSLNKLRALNAHHNRSLAISTLQSLSTALLKRSLLSDLAHLTPHISTPPSHPYFLPLSLLAHIFTNHNLLNTISTMNTLRGHFNTHLHKQKIERMIGRKIRDGWGGKVRVAFGRIRNGISGNGQGIGGDKKRREGLREGLRVLMMLFRYNSSTIAKSLTQISFTDLKDFSSKKKDQELQMKRVCIKVDSILKQQLAGASLPPISPPKLTLSDELTHNYKIAFHFMELYIKAKRMKKGFKGIGEVARERRLEMVRSGVRCFEYFACKSEMYVAMGRLALYARSELVQEQLAELSYLRYRSNRRRQMLTIAKVHFEEKKLRNMFVLDQVQVALPLLNKLFTREAFDRIKSLTILKKSAVQVISIKAEIILLKGKKKAFHNAFIELHKNMVKGRHAEEKQMNLFVNRAATLIQSLFRMIQARRRYLAKLFACVRIQRAFKRYRVEKKKKALQTEKLLMKRQKERLTQIREHTLLRMKENLCTNKPAAKGNMDNSPVRKEVLVAQKRRAPLEVHNSIEDFGKAIRKVSQSKKPNANFNQPKCSAATNSFASVKATSQNSSNQNTPGFGRGKDCQIPHRAFQPSRDKYLKVYKENIISNHIKERQSRSDYGQPLDELSSNLQDIRVPEPSFSIDPSEKSKKSSKQSKPEPRGKTTEMLEWRYAQMSADSLCKSDLAAGNSFDESQYWTGNKASEFSPNEAIRVKKENLQDLMNGVKERVRSIRRTERSNSYLS
jgi:hypothetical protein